MMVAGSFRAVRRADRVFSGRPPRPLPREGGGLDIRAFHLGRKGPPLLLVAAPRHTGNAVERNRFRRRVRMAFLAALRAGRAHGGFALWVRPAKGNLDGCRIGYRDIERQIGSSLGWLGHP